MITCEDKADDKKVALHSQAALKKNKDLDFSIIHEPFLDLKSNTGNTVLILASSKSGKTTLLNYLFSKYFKTKYISVLFSVNNHIGKYNRYDITAPRFVPEVVKAQKRLQTETDNMFKFVNITDDITNVHSKTFQEMICTWRNSDISSIICAQDPTMVRKSNRSNFNTIILGKFGRSRVQDVCKEYCRGLFRYPSGKVITSLNDMIDEYNRLTEDHQFIMITPDDNVCLIKVPQQYV